MAIDRTASGPFGGSKPLFNKRGIELQFHWIFILIAGALILSFFFSVAYKQREYSREKLELTLVTDIENIFTGAIVSRGTAQKLPVPPQGIAFECSSGCDCRFRIEREAKPFGDMAIFAPELLKDQDITVWALELKLPYRVTNFLYLTNPNIKYYLVRQPEAVSENLLKQITKNIPPLISYENITLNEISQLKNEDYQHTRFVFLNAEPTNLDKSFRRASADAIKIDPNGIGFYQKEGTEFTRIKYLSYVGLPSIYAAMFSQDNTMYECGLRTAFRKLSYVSYLYAERAAELQEKSFEAGREWCNYGAQEGTLCIAAPSTVVGMLCEQNKISQQLSVKLDDRLIRQLSSLSQHLDSFNINFLQQSCPELF
ncbi:MAG: hypothetical protein QW165_03765 [Candidatus Woesearchaeota archaeon]